MENMILIISGLIFCFAHKYKSNLFIFMNAFYYIISNLRVERILQWRYQYIWVYRLSIIMTGGERISSLNQDVDEL